MAAGRCGRRGPGGAPVDRFIRAGHVLPLRNKRPLIPVMEARCGCTQPPEIKQGHVERKLRLLS